uniref:non-ribosomal peptide synthetase n=1 Tax=Streptomyces sp. LS1784 TaxID=2851533 RepID=UPI001CCD3F2C
RSAPASDGFLRRTGSLDAPTLAALRRAARPAGASWPTAFTATVAAYLHRLSGERDIVLSMPVTGRTGSAAPAVPGMVANVVPLRLRVHPEQGLSALARQVAEEVAALRRHQRHRSEDLRRELDPAGSERVLFGPVVNIMSFYYHLDFAGVRATVHNLSNGPVEDLSFSVYDRSDGTEPRIDVDANPALYTEAELAAHQQRFLRFLNAVASADPDRPIGRPDLLTPEERHRTVVAANRTTRPLPHPTVPSAFAAEAARRPDAPAVVCGETTLSYAELNARANRLAHRLITLGVRCDSTVAVLMERSVDVVVSVLAISKAGGAYVPLDTRAPTARLRRVLDDTGAVVLLTHRATRDDALSLGTPGVVVDADPGLADQPATDPVVPLRPDHLACVLYTSGSTGTPKGVALSHRNVISLTAQRCWREEDGPRVLAHSPHAFDASTYEWWVPLLNGGRVVVAPPGELALADLHRLIVDHRVGALWLTAGLFRVFAEESPGTLAGVGQVWTGGDIVPADAVRRVLARCPDSVVVAGYGPTEATTFTTRRVLRPGQAVPDVVPLGRPVDNRQVYVLDEALSPVPPGVAGVLYVAGAGVARGYLNDPRRTAGQFVPCPFGEPGERMYRTGDVVRWNAEGELEFLGRADEQVKLHGFRIELGEIEAVLAGHPAVAQATVVAGPGPTPGRRLIGYVVPAGDAGLDPASVREHAAAALPDYMVPSAIVTLDAFPLTPRGKIDRAALPVPDPAPAPSGPGPRTPAERTMCALFAEVLGRPAVGVDDGFFALGGNSLLATRLVNRVRVRFGRELTLGALFQAPTPARLVEALKAAPDAAAVPELSPRTRL